MSIIFEVFGRRVQLKGLIGKRVMKCLYCDFYFMKNGLDFQCYIWVYEGVKFFKCFLCEYVICSKSNFKVYMNCYSIEKIYLCDMCGKKFKLKGILKSYKFFYIVDGKQFKCMVCDYIVVQKLQLLWYMEQYVFFKFFCCVYCYYFCNIFGFLKWYYNRKYFNEEYVNVGIGELVVEVFIQ